MSKSCADSGGESRVTRRIPRSAALLAAHRIYARARKWWPSVPKSIEYDRHGTTWRLLFVRWTSSSSGPLVPPRSDGLRGWAASGARSEPLQDPHLNSTRRAPAPEGRTVGARRARGRPCPRVNRAQNLIKNTRHLPTSILEGYCYFGSC